MTAGTSRQRNIIGFLIAGFSAVGTDYVVYRLLLIAELDPSFSKTISALIGTSVAYLLNKFVTFKQPHHSYSEIMRFMILYACTTGVNVLVNKSLLFTFAHWDQKINIAFLGATATSTVLNFIGQRLWVFRHHPQAAIPPLETEEAI